MIVLLLELVHISMRWPLVYRIAQIQRPPAQTSLLFKTREHTLFYRSFTLFGVVRIYEIKSRFPSGLNVGLQNRQFGIHFRWGTWFCICVCKIERQMAAYNRNRSETNVPSQEHYKLFHSSLEPRRKKGDNPIDVFALFCQPTRLLRGIFIDQTSSVFWCWTYGS